MPIKNLVQITMELWGALFCIVCFIVVFVGKRADDKRNKILQHLLVSDVVLLVADSLAYIYRGNETVTGYYMVRVSNFLVFATYVLISYSFVRYAGTLIEVAGNKYNKKWELASAILGVITIVAIIASRFIGIFYIFDASNLYHRASGYLIFAGLLYSNVLLVFIFVIRHYKLFRGRDYWSMVLFIIIMVIIMTIQNLFYGISFANIAVVMISFLIFLQYEVEMTGLVLNQELELQKEKANVAEKNVELAEYRAKILLSQIQPHFLFNALTAIKALITRDPANATKAVDHLAGFLRASLDSLGHTGLISIEQEMNTTKDYLAMQQYRFGDRLEVEISEDSDTFYLPPFSIQPLVENAVHHGIRKKRNGKVTVKSFEEDNKYVIEVIDNGVGFNPDAAFNDGRNHYGMNIVRERLAELCGGELVITSEEGVGTTCRITIPKVEM